MRSDALYRRRFNRRNAIPPLRTSIAFHVEGGILPATPKATLVDWIAEVIKQRGGKVGDLNYIFCADDYLHALNVEYLDHDTLTDIITFPYADFPLISGDLFISTDRVTENAGEYGLAVEEELLRVMIHGILHLCGQGDKCDEEKNAMRDLEKWALSLII